MHVCDDLSSPVPCVSFCAVHGMCMWKEGMSRDSNEAGRGFSERFAAQIFPLVNKTADEPRAS
jgi:hypothetical protein